MENRKIKGKRMLRPLLLVSAVGIACQSIVAQAAPTIASTPFANRPLHLQSDTVKLGATRPKPNVMFFVDDSGSMQSLVGGKTEWDNDFVRYFPNPKKYTCQNNTACYKYTENGQVYYTYNSKRRGLETEGQYMMRQLIGLNYANAMPCSFLLSTLGTDNTCYRLNWPLSGFFRLKQQNNRIRIAIDALTAVVNKRQDNWNWNIYTLWGSEMRRFPGYNGESEENSVNHKFMNAAEMKEFLKGLSPTYNTPSTERYVRLARIMKDSIEYRCQKSYVVVVSDGDANDARIPELNSWEKKLYGEFQFSPVPGDNNSDRYIRKFKGNRTYYEPYESGAENGISLFSNILASADLKNKESRVGSGQAGRDKEGGFWDEHVNPNDPDDPYTNTEDTVQSIKTFTVGFGEGLSPNGKAYLRDAATCEEPKDKCFFTPTTAQELAEALDIIQENIAAENASGAIVANSSGAPATTSSSSVASLAATLSLNTGIWGSELKFIKLNPNTGKPTKDIVEPVYSGRRILVNNDGHKYWLDSVALSAKSDFDINTEEEFKNGFIPWLTRDVNKSDAQIEADVAALSLGSSRTVKKYRKRAPGALDAARQMADVVDAPIRAFGKDAQGRQKFIVTAANDGMVYIFESAANTSAPNKDEYVLKVNYLPAAMQRESADQSITVGKSIRATAEDGYGTDNIIQPHLYLNNGGISWAKTPSTGGFGQEYLVLGNMGQGGRGSYALTIGGEKRDNTSNTIIPAGLESSDPLNSLPLWETPKGSANQMGYTIGTGQIAQVATLWDNSSTPPKKDISQGVRIFAFIANGYKSDEPSVPYDSSPTLYVYEMMGQEFGTGISKKDKKSTSSGDPAGHLVTKVSVGNDPVTGAAAGALSSPTLLDNDYDGLADFAYAGDQYGNMYRFDLRDVPANWGGKVRKIYHGNPTQPITAAPGLHRISQDKYVVIFGTGSDIYDKDRTNIDEQVIMGIYDDLSVEVPAILTSSSNNILDQQLNTNDAARERRLSQNSFDKNLHKAWRVKLTIGKSSNNGKNIVSSEKVVVRPEMLVGTAFLTSRIYKFEETTKSLPPNVDMKRTCYSAGSTKKTSGEGWLMAINAETGGAPDIKTTGFVRDFGSGVIGTKIDGIPSVVIFASRQDGSQRLPSGAFADGGVVPNLDPSGGGNDQVNTKCVPVEFDLTLGLQSSDPNNPYLSFKGDAPRCEVEIIRANWREVPL